MKKKLLAMALFTGGAMFAQTRVSIGFGVGGYGPGAYAPVPSYQQVIPPCPGPGYSWVDGYYAPQQGRNVWVQGYWSAPRTYVQPRNFGHQAFLEQDRGFRGHDRDDHRDRGRSRGYSQSFRNH